MDLLNKRLLHLVKVEGTYFSVQIPACKEVAMCSCI